MPVSMANRMISLRCLVLVADAAVKMRSSSPGWSRLSLWSFGTFRRRLASGFSRNGMPHSLRAISNRLWIGPNWRFREVGLISLRRSSLYAAKSCTDSSESRLEHNGWRRNALRIARSILALRLLAQTSSQYRWTSSARVTDRSDFGSGGSSPLSAWASICLAQIAASLFD